VVNSLGVEGVDAGSTRVGVVPAVGWTEGPAGGLPGPVPPIPVSRHALEMLRRIQIAATVLVTAFAGAVLLVGWGLDVPAARGLSPGSVVRPVTACCLLLLAIALGLSRTDRRRSRHRVGVACAGVAGLVSVLALVEHLTGTDPGLDRLLPWPETVTRPALADPGRMAADAAVGVGLLAAAHLLLLARARWAAASSQLLAAGAGLVGVTAAYNTAYYYAFRGSPLEQAPSGSALAVALALIVLGAGTIAVRPDAGLVRVMASDSVGGLLGRRLLAAAATVPFVLGWLPVLARQNGLYGQRLGVAFLITGNAVAFGVVGFVAANFATRLEASEAHAVRVASAGHAELVALIDNTSAVIYMRDLDGRYALVNREYERLFGVRRENIVGRTDHDLFPPEIADDFRANDLAAVARGSPVSMEEVAPGDDGPHTYITVKFPLLDDEGRPYAVCGISTDITKRKRAEEEVRRLNAGLEERVRQRTAELEASTRELDAFAYSVSHDLRAPLRSLGGFSQLLLDDYGDKLDGDGKDYLNRLQTNVARMGQMIDDLLDLSRATRVELHRQPVDLSELAAGIVAELRSADPGRQVDVTVADGLTGSGDSRLLRLMLHNLLANAWKFTGKQPTPRIEVGSARDGAGEVFYVRDNGAGFSMRYADKLFDPFQRLHPSAEYEGSGLGLAIVQRILGRHGGRVWADSEPDRGATFYFTLTAAVEDARGQRRDLVGRGQPR